MRALVAIAALVLVGCAAEAQISNVSMNCGMIGHAQYNYAKCKQIEANHNSLTLSARVSNIIENAEKRWIEENSNQQVGDGWFDRRRSFQIFLSDEDIIFLKTGPEQPWVASRRDLIQRAVDRAERSAQISTNVPKLSCHGIASQGGLAICETIPNAAIEVGRAEDDTYTQYSDDEGIVIVGFDRDEPPAFIRVKNPRLDLYPDEKGEKPEWAYRVIKGEARIDFDIAPRDYDISRIDGLPSNMVSTYTDEELARIRSASARKKVGFASKVEEIGFRDGFIYPVTEHRKTTNFGAQRILNGEPKRPHFGVDLAAPKGTPILAPADGIVSLADDDMYFEGSLIMIDHGQGLISYYLHNEDILVEEGQRVKQGDQIGTVGSRGRSTGPHLCWRLKWRGRNLDPELLVNWQSEAKVHG